MSSPVGYNNGSRTSSPVVSHYDSVTRGVAYFSSLFEFSEFCASTPDLEILAYNRSQGKNVRVERGEGSVYDKLRKVIDSFPVTTGVSYGVRQVSVVALDKGIPVAESDEVTLGVRPGR